MTISLFQPFKTKEGKFSPGVKPEQDLSYDSYFAYIRDGKWEEQVLNYRAGRIEKTAVPGVTPSGTFSYRSTGNLIAHSGVIALDFDHKDNPDFDPGEVAADPHVWAMHRSISGYGWVVYVRIDPERHTDAYLALERHFANQYKVVADPSGKDVTRFRFVSYDPDLYRNEGAKVWKKYLPKKEVMPAGKIFVHTENDIEHIINQITAQGINLTEAYHDWVKIGMAFASAYGEKGREYFHAVSQVSTKYNAEKCDQKYTNLLKTTVGKVGIASFFWLAQLAGVEIKTARTQHIERVAKMQMKVVGTNGGHKDKDAAGEAAVKVLSEMDMIYGPDVEQVVEQVKALPADQLSDPGANADLIADLKEFLRTYQMQFNEVTRLIEIDGEPVNDRLFNSIYVKALEVMKAGGKGKAPITKDLLFSIMDSDFTKSYHPLKDFFSKHANMKPSGEIERLFSSIKIKPIRYDEGRQIDGTDYLRIYFRKWLLSCVASWHGTYSVMMAVLTGEQMNGKTNFFRWLLPEELRAYYAESRLDAGKDDEILMTQKAIICDDEYGGKSKMEYKRLKELISKQTFTIRKPYGRISEDLTRIAVLCGTSNEEEIINDPTGNRRIIPVPVDRIDWAVYNSIDKTALWMEVYHEWRKAGDEWMLTRDEVKALNKLSTRHEQVSQEEESLWMFFDLPKNGGITEYLTNTEIRNYIEMNTRLKLSQTKLGLALIKCGFEKQQKKIGGLVRLVYPVVKRRSEAESGPTPF